jgi:hypothetical protein
LMFHGGGTASSSSGCTSCIQLEDASGTILLENNSGSIELENGP